MHSAISYVSSTMYKTHESTTSPLFHSTCCRIPGQSVRISRQPTSPCGMQPAFLEPVLTGDTHSLWVFLNPLGVPWLGTHRANGRGAENRSSTGVALASMVEIPIMLAKGSCLHAGAFALKTSIKRWFLKRRRSLKRFDGRLYSSLK